jgi:uncharacterized membrane protein
MREGGGSHHLLGLHHVRPRSDELTWDLAFLAWGVLMLIGGVALLRRPDPTRHLEGDDHG